MSAHKISKFLAWLLVFLLLIVACGGAEEVEVTTVVEVPVEITRVITMSEEVEGQQVEVTRVVEESVSVEAEEEMAAEEPPLPVMTVEPAAQAPQDMFFENYGVNPFIDTEDDNLSTFAIDVDTGAYTLMRSYIQDGSLPPKDSVRVEEYINYFDHHYPLPESGAFAIHLEGAPAPYGESDKYHLLRVGLQGYQVPDEERPDALLIYVVDVSGSMQQGERLELVKHGLRALLHQLRPDDRVGIVAYGSTAEVVLEPAYVSARQTILDGINRLVPGGSTNAEQGIMLGYQLADEHMLPDQITRLVVASDGVANVGQTTADAILDYAREGVSLSTFGVGMGNYNDVLMEQLADDGDGAYFYLDSRDEAEKVFYEHVTGTILTIAQDAKIQVEFNPEVVERYRLLGYENRAVEDEEFRDDTVDAGEIGAGHSVTALYEIKFVDEVSPADEAAIVRVRYEEPESGEVVEIAESISPGEFATRFTDASPDLQMCAIIAEYAEILRESYWAQGNTLASVAEEAQRVAGLMPDDQDVQEFMTLAMTANALAQ